MVLSVFNETGDSHEVSLDCVVRAKRAGLYLHPHPPTYTLDCMHLVMDPIPASIVTNDIRLVKMAAGIGSSV